MDIFSILRSATFQILSSVFRTLAVAGVAWLTTKSLIDQATATQLTGLLPTVAVAVVWSVIEKYVIERFHLARTITALTLPENSTMADLKQAGAQSASASTVQVKTEGIERKDDSHGE